MQAFQLLNEHFIENPEKFSLLGPASRLFFNVSKDEVKQKIILFLNKLIEDSDKSVTRFNAMSQHIDALMDSNNIHFYDLGRFFIGQFNVTWREILLKI